MQTIAHIHRDATITWDEVADPGQRLLEECGDVILNLLDVWDPSQFSSTTSLSAGRTGGTSHSPASPF